MRKHSSRLSRVQMPSSPLSLLRPVTRLRRATLTKRGAGSRNLRSKTAPTLCRGCFVLVWSYWPRKCLRNPQLLLTMFTKEALMSILLPLSAVVVPTITTLLPTVSAPEVVALPFCLKVVDESVVTVPVVLAPIGSTTKVEPLIEVTTPRVTFLSIASHERCMAFLARNAQE